MVVVTLLGLVILFAIIVVTLCDVNHVIPVSNRSLWWYNNVNAFNDKYFIITYITKTSFSPYNYGILHCDIYDLNLNKINNESLIIGNGISSYGVMNASQCQCNSICNNNNNIMFVWTQQNVNNNNGQISYKMQSKILFIDNTTSNITMSDILYPDNIYNETWLPPSNPLCLCDGETNNFTVIWQRNNNTLFTMYHYLTVITDEGVTNKYTQIFQDEWKQSQEIQEWIATVPTIYESKNSLNGILHRKDIITMYDKDITQYVEHPMSPCKNIKRSLCDINGLDIIPLSISNTWIILHSNKTLKNPFISLIKSEDGIYDTPQNAMLNSISLPFPKMLNIIHIKEVISMNNININTTYFYCVYIDNSLSNIYGVLYSLYLSDPTKWSQWKIQQIYNKPMLIYTFTNNQTPYGISLDVINETAIISWSSYHQSLNGDTSLTLINI